MSIYNINPTLKISAPFPLIYWMSLLVSMILFTHWCSLKTLRSPSQTSCISSNFFMWKKPYIFFFRQHYNYCLNYPGLWPKITVKTLPSVGIWTNAKMLRGWEHFCKPVCLSSNHSLLLWQMARSVLFMIKGNSLSQKDHHSWCFICGPLITMLHLREMTESLGFGASY